MTELDTLDGKDPAEENVTKLVIDRSKEGNPETHAMQLELRQRSQLPADVVERNQDRLRRFYDVEDDYKALDRAPTVRRKIVEDPGVAAVISDDYMPTGILESTIRSVTDPAADIIEATGQSWRNTTDAIERNDIYYRAVTGDITEEDKARIGQLDQRLQENSGGDEGLPWVGNFFYYGAETVNQMMTGFLRSGDIMLKGALAGGTIGATTGASVGTVGGPAGAAGGMVAGAGTGMIAGTSAGARAGQFEFMRQQETGSAFPEFAAVTDENGEAIDPEAAKAAAQIYGYISASIELFGIEQLFTRVPGLAKYAEAGGLTKDAMIKMLKVPRVRDALVKNTGTLAATTSAEMVTEGLQVLVQSAVQGGLTFSEFGDADFGDPNELLEEIQESMRQAFYGSAGVGAVGLAAPTYFEAMDAHRRKKLTGHWLDLGKASDNKLADRDPELHDEIVNEVNDRKNSVFIDSEKLQAYMQEEGIDLDGLQKSAPKTAADLSAAIDEGRAVQIDFAEFNRVFTRTDKYTTHLIQHLRRDAPDALTLAEYEMIQDDRTTLNDEYDSIMEQIEKNEGKSGNYIYNTVLDQLVRAGQAPGPASHQAALHQAFFTQQAAKADIDPVKLFKRMNLDIRQERDDAPPPREAITRTDAMLNAIRTGKGPSAKEVHGDSLGEFIIKEGGLKEDGGELLSRDLHLASARYNNRKLMKADGMSLETAYERAVEEGYIPGGEPSNILMDYLDQDIEGSKPIYSPKNENFLKQWNAWEIEHLEQVLETMKIDPEKFTNKEIRAKLETETLFQVQLDDLTPQEKRIVTKQLKRTDHPDQVKQLLKDYAGTPWASQAIEAALTREAIERMIAGKPVNFRNAFTSNAASVKKWKAAIEANGEAAIKDIIVSGGFIGHPEKPGQAVNSSFLNCEPSQGCAKYCYAATGNYVYSQNIIRSELVTMLVENDPVWAAGQVATEYKLTAEYMTNKALRMYDKGDGSAQWIPFYKELEAQGVRAQIFSKRPEILRQVSDYHLRMLSVDVDSHAMSDGAKDLPWAYVYGGTKAEADYINANQDNIQVVLPIKLGHKFLTKDQIALLDPSLRPHVCPVDVGAVSIAPSVDVRDKSGNVVKRWSLKNSKTAAANVDKAEAQAKKIGGKTHRTKRQDWRCTDCDQNQGMGCFHGAATGELKKAQESGQVTPESMEAIREELTLLSRSDPGLAEKLASEFHTLLRQVRKGSVEKAEGANVQKAPEQTVTDGASGTELIPLTELHQAVYNQNKGKVYQGKIEFPEGREFFRITLTGKADLSTFLHESGHLFLETLNIIDRDHSNPETAKDLATILKWLNLDSFDEIETKHHEQFARGFEQYLMEGKAPSIALQDAFSRFKLWLKWIYSTISKLVGLAHGGGLSDEVRGVMDRMLASDAEIKQAKQQAGLVPIYKTAEEMDATPEAFAAYQAQYRKGHKAAADNLEQEALRDFYRQKTQDYKADREQAVAEITAEVNAQPWHVAKHFLRTGEFLDGGAVPPEMVGAKLRTDDVKQIIPDPQILRRLGPGLHSKNGMDPEQVAEFFGYDTGEELLVALQNAGNRKNAIKEKVDARMAQLHPDMMDDGAKLAEKAIEALHNESISEALLKELNALAKKAGGITAPQSAAFVKKAAKDKVLEIKMADLRPEQYRTAEQQNMRKAFIEAGKGNHVAAAEFKRKQIQNHWMYREAVKARAEFDQIRNRLNKYTKTKERAKLGKADPSYRDQIDSILEKVDLRKGVSKAEARARQNLAEWIQEQEEKGTMVAISPEMIQDSAYKSYKEMTLEEFRNVQDVVLHIAHLATAINRINTREGKRALDNQAEIVARTIESNMTLKTVNMGHRGVADDVSDTFSTFHAQMQKREFLFRKMDGDIINGPVAQRIFQPLRDAQGKKQDMELEYGKRLNVIMRKINASGRKRLRRKVKIGDTTFTVKQLFSVALNMGNEGNKFKMLDGRKWTEQQVMTVLEANLTADDLRAVQEIWDLIDTLWPAISQLQERNTGLLPVKVEAARLDIKSSDGETLSLQGGYFPVIYDTKLSHRAAKNAQHDAMELFPTNFMRPGVSKGFTEARSATYSDVVEIRPENIGQHLNEVIHFITHHDAVVAADKLIKHPRVKEAMIAHAGQKNYELMNSWLQNIGRDGRPEILPNSLNDFAGFMHRGMTVAIMGLNFGTAMTQFLGIPNVAGEVGVKYLRQGTHEIFKGGRIFHNLKEIEKVSSAFAHVQQNFDMNIRNQLKHMGARPGAKEVDFMRQFAFRPISEIQRVVSGIAWQAGYMRALDEGKTHAEAVQDADATMEQTQSSSAPKDTPHLQASGNNFVRGLTAFMSFFMTLFNQLDSAFSGVKHGRRKRLAQVLLFYIVIPTILDKMMRDGLPDDEEEIPEYLGELGLGMLGYVVGTIPVVRGFSSYGYGGAPADQFLDQQASVLQRVPGKVWTMITDPHGNEEFTDYEIRKMAEAVAVATRLPVAKPVGYYQNLRDMMEEGPADPTVTGIPRELLWGPPKD